MSDEMFVQEEEAAGEEQQPTVGKKKIGFLPAIVIDILKWSAIVIGAIIFIVVTVIITVRLMGRGSQATATRLPLESEYQDDSQELLDWYSEFGEIRGRTNDDVPRTFIVTPHIGVSPRGRRGVARTDPTERADQRDDQHGAGGALHQRVRRE